MASKSSLTYRERAQSHRNPVARRLFEIAEEKKTNVVVSADLTTTAELLDIADELGPHIAVFKTHIDIVSDFSEATVQGLKDLSAKHNFLIFEDRKFVDIGNTVQKQYHGGALRISEWAHLVNASVLAGDGIIEALSQTAASEQIPHRGERALLILAEMTTQGSLAVGDYTQASISSAKRHRDFVVGFVATRALTAVDFESASGAAAEDEDDDFVVFTTGVSRAAKGDKLGQQYQTPRDAVGRGADFIIAGRGIYATEDPVVTAKLYQDEGWTAYLARVA